MPSPPQEEPGTEALLAKEPLSDDEEDYAVSAGRRPGVDSDLFVRPFSWHTQLPTAVPITACTMAQEEEEPADEDLLDSDEDEDDAPTPPPSKRKRTSQAAEEEDLEEGVRFLIDGKTCWVSRGWRSLRDAWR